VIRTQCIGTSVTSVSQWDPCPCFGWASRCEPSEVRDVCKMRGTWQVMLQGISTPPKRFQSFWVSITRKHGWPTMSSESSIFYFQWRFIVTSLFSFALARLIYFRYYAHLRMIPGPRLASFSSLHRLWTAATGKQFIIQQELHEEYGPLVRVGPNHVSVSDAASIVDIYGISTKFYKVGWCCDMGWPRVLTWNRTE
jgi:hypothetical protein